MSEEMSYEEAENAVIALMDRLARMRGTTWHPKSRMWFETDGGLGEDVIEAMTTAALEGGGYITLPRGPREVASIRIYRQSAYGTTLKEACEEWYRRMHQRHYHEIFGPLSVDRGRQRGRE